MAQQHMTWWTNVAVALTGGSIPFVGACIARAGTVDERLGEATLLGDAGVVAAMPMWVVLASLLYQLLTPAEPAGRWSERNRR